MEEEDITEKQVVFQRPAAQAGYGLWVVYAPFGAHFCKDNICLCNLLRHGKTKAVIAR